MKFSLIYSAIFGYTNYITNCHFHALPTELTEIYFLCLSDLFLDLFFLVALISLRRATALAYRQNVVASCPPPHCPASQISRNVYRFLASLDCSPTQVMRSFHALHNFLCVTCIHTKISATYSLALSASLNVRQSETTNLVINTPLVPDGIARHKNITLAQCFQHP